jgi:uncharacterized phage protein (TIGR01671 family)
MRTIKFRAWDTKFKEWCNYFYIDNNGNAHTKFGSIDDIESNNRYWEEYVIINQFTGLTDKNGKEIYEGDICNTRDGDLLTCYDYNSFIYMVLFSEEHSGVNGYSQKELEVIGNIYENPELLKKE